VGRCCQLIAESSFQQAAEPEASQTTEETVEDFMFLLMGCGAYNFTGGDVGTATSFQVNYFQNYASQSPGSTFEPGLDRDFTLALQDLILNQTSLDLRNSDADLIYEGEIVEFRISPMTATAQQRAAQNRLTMGVNVRFFNRTKEDVDWWNNA